jgi:hypothetical protein
MCCTSFLFILLSCQIIDNLLATLANYFIIHSTNKSAIFAHGDNRFTTWEEDWSTQSTLAIISPAFKYNEECVSCQTKSHQHVTLNELTQGETKG